MHLLNEWQKDVCVGVFDEIEFENNNRYFLTWFSVAYFTEWGLPTENIHGTYTKQRILGCLHGRDCEAAGLRFFQAMQRGGLDSGPGPNFARPRLWKFPLVTLCFWKGRIFASKYTDMNWKNRWHTFRSNWAIFMVTTCRALRNRKLTYNKLHLTQPNLTEPNLTWSNLT